MRNLSKTAGLIALMTASSMAHAEFVGLEIGIAGWQAAPSGWVEDASTAGSGRADLEDDLQLDDQTAGFAWLRVMHPIPLLPNAKLSYTPLQFEGSGSSSFTFAGATYNERVDSEAQLDQWDAALFYEVLDNVVDLDVGLNVKVLDGYFKTTSQTTGETRQVDFSAPIPMLYANAGVNLPLTGLSLAVEGSAVGYSGHSLSDIKAGVRYTMLGVVGLEAGYRALRVKIDDLEDVSADVKVGGPYLGVAARF
jgi:outer membrane protein